MRSLFRLLLVAAALMLVPVLGAACGSNPAPAAPTQAPVSVQATAPQATQPAANPPTASVQQDSQDAGPSLTKNPAAANTRHYQGDPNAPVVLIEISDFQ